ncbi:MAG: GGDEF domain-containing protein [Alphaproteobacteria bacterium HGW-Alphaproteobacteria-18]|nr:MAG: GGDEF domain-containing protein [Alphaproteobacteria bacterium HGW-Alphaproteobacteria-18]
MSAEFFIMLLNPGIGALLAAAFLMLWLNQRDKLYILFATAAYAMTALAFFLQDVAFQYIASPLPGNAERFFSNTGFLLSGWFLVMAVLGRFELRPSYWLLATVSLIALASLAWFMLVQPSVAGRVLSINAALGLMMLMIVVKTAPVPNKHLADRILLWITILATANSLVRPVLILWLAGDLNNANDFQHSLYWTTVQFTQPLISVAFALTLMVAIAMDLIGQLRHEARTDKLSGLLNRGGFEAAAEALLKRGRAGSSLPVCLIIADLDHFKQINDTFGHSVGDAVIGLFGRHIAAMTSDKMIAGRIGGEEFAVLLPGHEIQAARLFAESLRACPWGYWSGMLPGGLTPSVSIGVCAAWPGADLYSLMRNADEALYDAKRAGRDQVRLFGIKPSPAPSMTAAISRIRVKS